MARKQLFAISVEPEFDEVLKRIDELVVQTGTNRSAVTRDILYDHFNIPRPAAHVMDRSDVAKRRRGVSNGQ